MDCSAILPPVSGCTAGNGGGVQVERGRWFHLILLSESRAVIRPANNRQIGYVCYRETMIFTILCSFSVDTFRRYIPTGSMLVGMWIFGSVGTKSETMIRPVRSVSDTVQFL